MEYLEEFNLTIEDINDIKSNFTEDDYSEFVLYEDKIKEILNYLINKGIYNIKNLIMYKPNLFYEDIDFIKSKLDNLNPNSINKINLDINELDNYGI